MKIFNNLDEIQDIQNTVVAMGNFDGIHKGHKELISRCVSAAGSAGMKSAVFTFSNHPKNFFKPGSVKTLLTFEEKKEVLESLGIDYLFNLPFDESICTISPERYIDELLIGKFNMKEAYCGFNYRFGYKAEGNTEFLMKMSLKKGFGIHVMEPFSVDGEVVSSSKIREYIESGNMPKVTALMGRYYSITGEVVKGNELGRTIGFPTANVKLEEYMVGPLNGVYATECMVDGRRYKSITNVGNKPTIGQYDKNVETNIFDFDESIYGKTITTKFIKMIRTEKKFSGLEELKNQIENDCINVKAFHRTNFKD